jgi:hypothetical protein
MISWPRSVVVAAIGCLTRVPPETKKSRGFRCRAFVSSRLVIDSTDSGLSVNCFFEMLRALHCYLTAGLHDPPFDLARREQARSAGVHPLMAAPDLIPDTDTREAWDALPLNLQRMLDHLRPPDAGVLRRPAVLERAFELAGSGECERVDGIERILRREGYFGDQLKGPLLRRQLREAIAGHFSPLRLGGRTRSQSKRR